MIAISLHTLCIAAPVKLVLKWIRSGEFRLVLVRSVD